MKTEEPATHSLGGTLTLSALIAVALGGLAVIIGWHLHVPALVQIIPGTIPMQYNTALCFLVLGASACLLVVRRFHRLLPLVGGAFVALMGALVVFEYLTGISLGIDTAFFYPWNRTLSADPGRMALTSAISFVCAGSALVLLVWRPGWLAAFAIAHTLPLSFGLTSLLGYVLGITYVLPFHLGSQMAVHTALAFTAYGGVVLAYIWRRAPQTKQGLPRWSPGIATILLPVLFVGFNAISPGESAATRGVQLLVAITGVAFFGFAIYKLTRTKIAYRGLILISIPLIFLLAFVILVTTLKRRNKEAQNWSSHSKEVIAQTEALSEELVEAESSIRGYVITNNPSFVEAYTQATRKVPEEVKRLRALVSDNPQQEARAESLETKALERMALLGEVEQLMRSGASARATERVESGMGLEKMNEFRSEMDLFLREEERLDAERQKEMEDSWQQFDWLLVAGTSADILLAFLLAFLFSRGIGNRLRVLTRNTEALAVGKKLAEPLSGTDEIAHLDQVFHQMAEEIRKSHDELERRVQERTSELEQASVEIRKLNEELEHRVVERTAQLEAANRELEAFSYSISHDLRAPLRAMNGFSRILLEDYAPEMPEEARRYVNIVRDNAQQMGRLVDDLLSFSRLSRQALQKQKVEPLNLVRQTLDELRGEQPARQIEISIGDLPACQADPALLKQVYVNLLSNAIKYTQKRDVAKIEVGCRNGRNGSHERVYFIRDNGVGFDMKYADKLFGVFQRLHRAEEFEGTGVGLAIVQRVINRHGGRIWADAEPDKGATFYFTLDGDSSND